MAPMAVACRGRLIRQVLGEPAYKQYCESVYLLLDCMDYTRYRACLGMMYQSL